MKKIYQFLSIFTILIITSGCGAYKHHWDQLDTGEKVAVGVGVAVIAGALIIRNGEQGTVNNCISTRSIQTGCLNTGFIQP